MNSVEGSRIFFSLNSTEKIFFENLKPFSVAVV